MVYLLELLFSFPLAGAKALFARRLPRGDNGDSSLVEVSSGLTGKRGSVEVASWLPPVYLRDLPFAAAVVTGATWFVIITGVALSNVFTVADALARPGVLFGVATLVVGQSVEAWRDYVREGATRRRRRTRSWRRRPDRRSSLRSCCWWSPVQMALSGGQPRRAGLGEAPRRVVGPPGETRGRWADHRVALRARRDRRAARPGGGPRRPPRTQASRPLDARRCTPGCSTSWGGWPRSPRYRSSSPG